MALVDLKSNLANFRSDFNPMSLETRIAKPKSSNINIDSIPEPVSKKSSLAPFSRKLTSSLLNIDDIPGKFSPGEIYRPSRYAIAKIVNASRFNIDSSPEKFSPSGIFLPSKFNIEKIINVSRFNIDTVPVKFSPVGKYTPSKYAAEAKLPTTITRWVGANGKAAEAVNYISDTKFGLRGFATNFTDPNASKFLGVAGTPLQNKFVYPATIVGNRLMKPAQSAAFPGPQNFIDDIKFGATGFTTNLGKSGLAEKSQFLGISGAPGNKKYLYPGDKLLQGNRLMKPGFSSQQFDKKQYGIEQDFLNNVASNGFTTNMNLATTLEKSQFKGISGLSFTLPDTYIIPDTISTGPTGFEIGKTSLNNQLGNGSRFKYLKDGALTSKIFSAKGYNFSRRYDSVVANIKNQPQKSLLYNSSNPAALEEEYKKFSLRDDAHQTTYMLQPYILRGIQRKGNEKPQYWGFGSRSGFDDGLIRGGVVTVLDRIVADTVRIAKWMASPKGLLWIVKQIGLGLTNPKVEAIGGILTRQTRIHLGVTSLLSVPGTALGLHFTRHGIPFLNQSSYYEDVIKFKQFGVAGVGGNTKYSRLGELMKEFAVALPKTKFEEVGRFIKVVKSKTLLNSLSGYGGAQSVYGIGYTSIRRVVDTTTDAKTNAQNNKFSQVYKDTQQYASKVSTAQTNNNTLSPTKDATGNTAALVDEIKSQFVQSFETRDSLKSRLSTIEKTPGAKLNSTDVDLSTAKTRNIAYTSTVITPTGINSYLTLAYNKIPKDKYKNGFRDFRKDINIEGIAESTAVHILGTGILTNPKDLPNLVQDYDSDNLETRYGFGTQGNQGITTTPAIGPGSFIHTGTDFNRKTKDRLALTSDANFRGDKVTAIDIGSQTTPVASSAINPQGAKDLIKFWFEDAEVGKNVMPFRCTLTGLSDAFSPGWNRIDIMGRPDGAYLYSSFERTISFAFKAHATSRSEMIPMWRKLNYLASYTMPDYNKAGTKPSGPFMRLTIGDLYYRCPGFITALSYTFPDEESWDIAADYNVDTNADPKQLPMSVEVSVSYTIINDYRPQLSGRVYSLSPFGQSKTNIKGQWLADAEGILDSK